MAKKKVVEKEILHVLKRPDGSIRAELMMSPSMAATINANRKKRGFLDGDWEPQKESEYGQWHLDQNKTPAWIMNVLKEVVQDVKREASQHN